MKKDIRDDNERAVKIREFLNGLTNEELGYIVKNEIRQADVILEYLERVRRSLNMSTEDKVKDIIVEMLVVKKEKVKMESSFVEDLGIDSLDAVEITMLLEEKFDIEISDEDVEKLATVGDVVKHVEMLIAQK